MPSRLIKIPGGKGLHCVLVLLYLMIANLFGQVPSVTQSSVRHSGVPERAIDGDTNGSFSAGSVTHTNTETNPWWTMDLNETVSINQLVIWNRTDGDTGLRLNGFKLFISEQPFSSTDPVLTENDPNVWTYTHGVAETEITVNAPTTGRYIRIQIPGTDKTLNLAEVVVIEEPVPSVTQSSVRHDGVPERAIDGNTNGSFSAGSVTHTNTETNPWWTMDLNETVSINHIVIWNRTDGDTGLRLNGFKLFISEQPFSSTDPVLTENDSNVWTYTHGVAETEITVNAPTTGRYIRIQIPGTDKTLNLAEVEVFDESEVVMPTPDPMTFASAPVATGTTSITMTATTATGTNGVEYYFTNTAGGGNDSGWQDSTTYVDTGLNPNTSYSYTVTARDKSAAQNSTAASSALSATTDPALYSLVVNSGSGDGNYEVSQVINITADAPSPGDVFDAWVINSGTPVIADANAASTTLTMAAGAVTITATYILAPDLTAPTPDPMTFASAPMATGTTSITMTATTATDGSGVEYYFTNTAGGGNDSGWQDSTTYVDTGLNPNTHYSYTVTARDKSAAQNSTAVSSALSATTDPDFTGLAVTQSSVRYDGVPERAIDGDTNGRFSDESVTHTNTEENPWWTMDLRGILSISQVVIWNRTDGDTGERLNGFKLFISEQPFSSTDPVVTENDPNVWTYTHGVAETEITINAPTTGRYIRIQIPGTDKTLNLAEVEVFDDSGVEVKPTPDPMTFASPPAAASTTSITMTATTATGINGVEYYFANTAGGGNDSGWQDSPTYTDTGLTLNTTYSYTVTARDKSAAQNTTAASLALSATTNPSQYALIVNSGSGDGNYEASQVINITADAPSPGDVFDAWVINSGTPVISDANASSTTLTMPAGAATITATYTLAPDLTAPTPDPMTFASAPTATGTTSITMTATTATDGNGVEYYFTNTAGGGNDSGWQDSTTYVDTGLTPNTTYSYTVTARDKSAAQNSTAASSALSVTTDPILYALTVNSGSGDGNYEAAQVVNITADAPSPGDVFDSWVINSGSPVIGNVNSSSTTLTMAAGAATITATYKTSVVILSTDFNSRTVSGTTAGNLNWTTNGVTDPGSLTAVDVNSTGILTTLHDTPEAQGYFAPNINVATNGPWSTDITLNLTSASLSLESVEFDYQYFTRRGLPQGFDKIVDWTIRVTGSVSGLLDTVLLTSPLGTSGSESVVFASPLSLNNSESYIVTLVADGLTSGTGGNHAALDSLTLNGTISSLNLAPSWTSNPVVKSNGQASIAYSGSLSGNASDPESDSLIFSKTNGPAWLSVATNGGLSGTPGSGDTGLNSFTVTVDDGVNPAVPVTVEITVDPLLFTLTVNSGTGDGNYQAAQVVNITADAPPSGQVFDSWVINSGSPVIANANASSTTLTMPVGAVTITATYGQESPLEALWINTVRPIARGLADIPMIDSDPGQTYRIGDGTHRSAFHYTIQMEMFMHGSRWLDRDDWFDDIIEGLRVIQQTHIFDLQDLRNDAISGIITLDEFLSNSNKSGSGNKRVIAFKDTSQAPTYYYSSDGNEKKLAAYIARAVSEMSRSPLDGADEILLLELTDFLVSDYLYSQATEVKAWHWVGDFANVFDRLDAKLSDPLGFYMSQKDFYSGMLTSEWSLFASAADCKSIIRRWNLLDRYSSAEKNILTGYLDRAYISFNQRLEEDAFFNYDIGRWSDHPSFAWASRLDGAFPSSSTPPAQDSQATLDTVAFRQLPAVLDALESGDVRYPSYYMSLKKRLGAQLIDNLLYYNAESVPLLTTYANGNNGWYNMKYTAGWGMGPGSRSFALVTTPWALVGSQDNRVHTLFSDMRNVVNAVDAPRVLARTQYYGRIVYPLSGNVLGSEDSSGIGSLLDARLLLIDMLMIGNTSDPLVSNGLYLDRIHVNWNDASNATAYEVWRGNTASDPNPTLIALADTSEYYDYTADLGQTYWYSIKPVNSTFTGTITNAVSGYRQSTPETVADPIVSQGLYSDRVEIKWSVAQNATIYEVYRGNSASDPSPVLLTATTDTEFSDFTAVSGQAYWYSVIAMNSFAAASSSNAVSGFSQSGTVEYSNWQDSYFAPADPEAAFTADADDDGIPNAVEYAIGARPDTVEANPVVITDNGATWTVQYPDANRGDATIQLMQSTDLMNWSPASTSVISSSNGIDIREATFSTTNMRMFFRIEVQ